MKTKWEYKRIYCDSYDEVADFLSTLEDDQSKLAKVRFRDGRGYDDDFMEVIFPAKEKVKHEAIL